MGGQKIYPYKCKICGKDFFIDRATLNKLNNGKYKNTYCSKECSKIAKHTGYDITCKNCGKIFYRRLQHIQSHENQFCCQNCANDYFHKLKSEIRRCEICGKEINVSKLSTQRFCSIECQGKWQSSQINELNPRSKKEKIQCDYCGEYFWEKQYKIKDFKNHFCCKECRQNWYSEVFSQDESYKEKCRIRGAFLLSQRSNKNDKINSKPQLIANSLLDKLHIEYEREKQFLYYSVDNYLIKYNLIIEIQGDYWHCNPIKYKNQISEIQSGVIRKDKAKHTYIKKEYGIDILYLWENDLYNNPDLCQELIRLYVDKKGILDNYNSFNYQLINDKINFSINKITPYQEQSFDLYKNKIYKKEDNVS